MLLSLSDANSFRSVDALAKLRLYNASKPISKLPAELIIEILTILVDEAQGNVAGTHDRVTGWIPATQFCAQWRKVALRSRGLWTRVWMKKLDLFKVFLERSVDQPLHIDTWRGRVNDTEYDEMFRHLVANMFRIRTLYLWQDLTGHRLSWLQGRRARQLESLRLHRIGLVLAPNNRRFATSSIAPDPSIMPKLRRLEVMSCVQEDWTPLLPSHLPAVTHLTIECFTQADQLDLLKRCYNVRRLSIRLINNRPDSGFQPPRMMLRHLTHLYLDSLSWATLKQATIPSIRHVRLTPRFGFATRESVFEACRAIKEIMGRIVNQVPISRLDHFNLVWGFHGILFVKAVTRMGQQRIFLYDNLPTYSMSDLSATALDALQDSTFGLGSIIRAMDLGHIKQRDIAALRRITSTRAAQGCAIYLLRNYDAFIGFLSFDSRPTNSPDLPHQSPTGVCGCDECHEMRIRAYPNLKDLGLCVEERYFRDHSSSNIDIFLGWLEERQRRGRELKVLRLRFGGGGREGAESLQTRISPFVTKVVLMEE